MAGTRWTFLILAIAIAIAAGSENAAEGQEGHLAALDQLCLDPFPCYASPYSTRDSCRESLLSRYLLGASVGARELLD